MRCTHFSRYYSVLLFTVVLFVSNCLFAGGIAPCKVVHPEMLLRDYQPDENDLSNWFEENIYKQTVSPEQREYLLRKLRLVNRSADFREARAYEPAMTEKWQHLPLKIIRLYKNKKYGKEPLALLCLEFGQAVFDNSGNLPEGLQPESDEYFVAPLSALSCYWYYNKGPEKSNYRTNEIPDVKIMAAQRPGLREARYVHGEMKFRDIFSFTPAALANLRAAVSDSDLYREILDMSQFNHYYHEIGSGGVISSLLNSYWRFKMSLLKYYTIADFEDETGQPYEVIVCPFFENDKTFKTEDRLLSFRGSTNWRDGYIILPKGTADNISFSDDMPALLARTILQCHNGFKNWTRPLGGNYSKLQGFAGFGTVLTKDFRLPLVGEGDRFYYFSDGLVTTLSEAENVYNNAIHLLDTVSIETMGRLQKEAAAPPKTNSKGILYRSQSYTISVKGQVYVLSAILTSYNENLHIAGIMIFNPFATKKEE